MNMCEYEEAERLWKMFYARESFRHCKATAQHILDAKLEVDQPLFFPLITAVHVLYARPFTRNNPVGYLEEVMIPPEHLHLHRSLLEHRHKIYSHRDAVGVPIPDSGPANQVVALRTEFELQLNLTEFNVRYTLMPSIIELSGLLQNKCDYYVCKLWEKYDSAVPKKIGRYMLNVQDPAKDMWLPLKS